mmetsp:Transcript_14723/g.34724  ORF Transcript_14723/g.34724 Transcript_14723/m.34724 type:complete len:212 (-) Transcript_14723:180-815(-)
MEVGGPPFRNIDNSGVQPLALHANTSTSTSTSGTQSDDPANPRLSVYEAERPSWGFFLVVLLVIVYVALLFIKLTAKLRMQVRQMIGGALLLLLVAYFMITLPVIPKRLECNWSEKTFKLVMACRTYSVPFVACRGVQLMQGCLLLNPLACLDAIGCWSDLNVATCAIRGVRILTSDLYRDIIFSPKGGVEQFLIAHAANNRASRSLSCNF